MNTSQGNDFSTMPSAASLRGGIDGSIEITFARRLLGQNIFDITDWATLYGIKFSKEQRRIAEKFPWNEDVLNSPCHFNEGKLVKDMYFAFLGIERIKGESLTVAKWLKVYPEIFYFADNPRHVGQPHTETILKFGWYMLLKDIVPDSTFKTPEEQMAMLPPEYEVPTTIAEVTKDILVFRKTGTCPNPSRWAACRERTVKTDKLPANYVSCVGDFSESSGLSVSYWDGAGDFFMGVGESRRPGK